MDALGNLFIEGSNYSPEVDFKVNGVLKMKGRALPERTSHLFEALKLWIERLEVPDVIFDINMDYLNTSSAMQLLHVLSKLEDNIAVRHITVNWYYEADDEEHYDTGVFISEKLTRTEFHYFITA